MIFRYPSSNMRLKYSFKLLSIFVYFFPPGDIIYPDTLFAGHINTRSRTNVYINRLTTLLEGEKHEDEGFE